MPPTLYTHLESPLGKLLLVSRDGKLNGLYFAKPSLVPVAADWVEKADEPVFTQARTQIAEWIAGTRREFNLPIGLHGTPFQTWVWNEIAMIPYGQTISYGELARRIGRSFRDARAVGTATGQNPVCWIVPCHRVVGRDGSLTGYAGGLPRKSALLDFEAARIAGSEVPLAETGMLAAA